MVFIFVHGMMVIERLAKNVWAVPCASDGSSLRLNPTGPSVLPARVTVVEPRHAVVSTVSSSAVQCVHQCQCNDRSFGSLRRTEATLAKRIIISTGLVEANVSVSVGATI